MSAGADIAADALIRKYAKPAKPLSPPGDFAIAFTGVGSTDDFIRLAAYLERMAVVKGDTPVRAEPGVLVYELQLSTGLAGFAKSAAKDGVIEPVGEDGTTTYRLR
jgi:hypothetical protein